MFFSTNTFLSAAQQSTEEEVPIIIPRKIELEKGKEIEFELFSVITNERGGKH